MADLNGKDGQEVPAAPLPGNGAEDADIRDLLQGMEATGATPGQALAMVAEAFEDETVLRMSMERFETMANSDEVLELLDDLAESVPDLAVAVFHRWGNGRKILGDLDLSDRAWITSVPDGLDIKGSLNLADCRSLTTLPLGLRVANGICLEACTALESPPEGFKAKGGLDLSDCSALRALPAGLAVGGDLNLHWCNHLASLPDGLLVIGSLIVSGCASLPLLPASLKVLGDLVLDRVCPLSLLTTGKIRAMAPRIRGNIERH